MEIIVLCWVFLVLVYFEGLTEGRSLRDQSGRVVRSLQDEVKVSVVEDKLW